MAYEFILTERSDGVAVITLNRPEKLNALSYPLVRELDEALSQYEADEDIKAVILTGAGDRAFSAGADIHEMAGLSSEELAARQDAKELLYTGRVVLPEEAERIGLLNQIVPAARLLDSCLEIAQMIAKNDARMVQGIKRLLHEEIGTGWRERYDNEERARATWLAAGHPREGFKDFLSRKS